MLRPLADVLAITTGGQPDATEPPALDELARRATRLRARTGAPPQLLEATAAFQDLACGLPRSRVRKRWRRPDRAARVAGRARERDRARARRAVPGDQRRAAAGLAGLRAADPSADGAVPLRRLGDQAASATAATPRSGSPTRRAPTACPTAATPTSASRSRSSTTAASASTPGYCTDRLGDRVPRCARSRSCTPAAAGWTRSSAPCATAPRVRSATRSTASRPASDVDYHGRREPAIEITKDGPYRVTGGDPAAPSRRRRRCRATTAPPGSTTRCVAAGSRRTSRSAAGMHWYVDFHDPVPDPERDPDDVRVGRRPAGADADDPTVLREARPPGPAARAAVCGHVGRPPRARRRLAGRGVRRTAGLQRATTAGYPRMLSQHVGKCLTEDWRQRWVHAAARVRAARPGCPTIPSSARRFSPTSNGAHASRLRTRRPTSHPPEHMPMPHWDWNTGAGPPGSRISALAPPAEDEPDAPIVLPAADEPRQLRRRTSSRCSAPATATR